MCKQIVQQLSLAQQKLALCRTPKTTHNLQSCSKSNWLQHQNIAGIQVCSDCFYAASSGSLLLQQEARLFLRTILTHDHVYVMIY